MTGIIVTPWGTRDSLPNDPSAPMHSALWNIAAEQAILERMKAAKEDWATAAKNISDKDVIAHLDTVCKDNGFRRIDGAGDGRDPNLINDGERIEVRIDPKSLTQPAKGVNEHTPLALAAYNNQVGKPDKSGVDINEKQSLDLFLGKIPGFDALADSAKAAVIEAYGRDRLNSGRVAALVGSPLFQQKLSAEEQTQLLATYNSPGKQTVTTEIDQMVNAPVNDENGVRLRVLSTPGFADLNGHQQQILLMRLAQDAQFRAGVGKIIGQENFRNKSSLQQAHALDILRGYSTHNQPGYIKIEEKNRAAVLVALYDNVLGAPEFKLQSPSPFATLSPLQNNQIKQFAEQQAPKIRA